MPKLVESVHIFEMHVVFSHAVMVTSLASCVSLPDLEADMVRGARSLDSGSKRLGISVSLTCNRSSLMANLMKCKMKTHCHQ